MIARGVACGFPARCLRRAAPTAARVAGTRRVHVQPRPAAEVQVATTEASEGSPAGSKFTLGEDSTSTTAAAAPSSYAELRRRPINFSPETRYTVDNVAEADAERFQLHSSVPFWRTYGTNMDVRSMGTGAEDSRRAPASTGETALNLLTSSALADAESAAYWAYHVGRTGFFLTTSAAGALAHHLSEQLSGGGRRTPFQNLSANAQAELTNRLYEGVAMFQQDLAAIKAGAYKLPWDMTTPTHRQFNPLYVASKATSFVGEAIGTLNRRIAQADASNWFSSSMYPKYYMDNTYHYQTDGWLSSRSANVYEFSTESLFFGRQDAMQRTVLLAMHEWLAETGRDPSSMRLLEVACGTGRFHTFIKDNYPEMQTVASDLSPFYLDAARKNVAYWKRQRQSGDLLGTDLAGAGTTFMQCAAESVPAPDESFDVVVCVYLFHELPEEARIACAKEWARVLRPGGLVVLADSCQLGDRPAWDPTLGSFGNFNEPHYRNYIACDIGGLMDSVGLQPRTKYLASATKALSFVKRGGAPAPADETAAADAYLAGEGRAEEAAEGAGDPRLN
ncbi:hypothetical protein MNEG_0776 [Monoraphidium neglectum]|uniref:Methyltransferase type 11 domain-containing protein n=1 Tax=Monoraphidium neglectum TaxID=145388 RepID=A0A0D2NSF7_9CHLO|nr:hypothetical protein MNEG_0776 [Monoraphidium neglectum]KIZ07181.1 hypothetical protein MNEG_0776 [Monoraphidium neglectum]|eukprot:XP_013906200.1 hypothetical protein MNEG_0776 [Monoraphidium neglectum]